jgi:hypothetical protein
VGLRPGRRATTLVIGGYWRRTSTPRVPVKPARMTRELTFTPHRRPEPTTPEKGGAEALARVVRRALDIQTHVEHPHRVGKRTDSKVIHTRAGVVRGSFQRKPAG